MGSSDQVGKLIAALADYRLRAKARRALQQLGADVAGARVAALVTDPSLPENSRWAAIMLVRAWAYASACGDLLQVVRTHPGLRGSAVSALQTITGLDIGEDEEEWERALADVNGYRAAHLQTGADAEEQGDTAAEHVELFRKALADIATEMSWEEEGYLYLRVPLEGGRKQQLVVTFNAVSKGGQPLTTIYTECGQPTASVLDTITRRNVTAKYGKFLVEKSEEGPDKVVMRETVPSHRLNLELAREIVLAIAMEADSLELEMTGADHI
ncbi:MAG: hypothetical protein JXR77_00920 [Lentisphaeria bacterium]|nr:hypothetical protein [Lentisphaeria bacterium]